MGENLAGRVAAVTGGASGIGEACATRLAADGAAVLVNCAGLQHVAPVHEFPPGKFRGWSAR